MKNLIQQLIRNELIDYADKITELTQEVNELNRRLANMIIAGVCIEVNKEHSRVKIRFGENSTPLIPWLSLYAGEVKEYRCPSIGETCLLLNYAAGDCVSQSFALFGIASNDFPLPTQNDKEILRVYPDGSQVLYNTEKHEMNIKCVGDIHVEAKGNAHVNASNIHLNKGSGVVTGAHICMVTGKPHGDCSSTVTAGK